MTPALRLSWRLATEADETAIRDLMKLAIEELQKDFLSPTQIAASHAVMGLDKQLIADRTYFIIEVGGEMAGCGGWGKRATLYGGDHSQGRSDSLLDPARDPARIRAMYTHPAFARRGIGRLVLALGERAAADAGFTRLTLGATKAGEPLYAAYGFKVVARTEDKTPSGVAVPVATMEKMIDRAAADRFIAAMSPAQDRVG
ncbi:MAG: GNAT family N-acetyltransferase [Pseudomonadota bacterium]|nr:GNAT family N-acetyltransferase [Pseudomonadota bacterium]